MTAPDGVDVAAVHLELAAGSGRDAGRRGRADPARGRAGRGGVPGADHPLGTAAGRSGRAPGDRRLRDAQLAVGAHRDRDADDLAAARRVRRRRDRPAGPGSGRRARVPPAGGGRRPGRRAAVRARRPAAPDQLAGHRPHRRPARHRDATRIATPRSCCCSTASRTSAGRRSRRWTSAYGRRPRSPSTTCGPATGSAWSTSAARSAASRPATAAATSYGSWTY